MFLKMIFIVRNEQDKEMTNEHQNVLNVMKSKATERSFRGIWKKVVNF